MIGMKLLRRGEYTTQYLQAIFVIYKGVNIIMRRYSEG